MIAPIVPSCVDLRAFGYMPLDVLRLRDSRIVSHLSAEAFRCAILLWCASWHQLPAASLPDDDVELAKFAGFGRAVREWRRYRQDALYGWVTCSDGRLYHPVVAEKALEAWEQRLTHLFRSECARIKKAAQRVKETPVYPTREQWQADYIKAIAGKASTTNVPRDSAGTNAARPKDVPGETPSKGTEQNVSKATAGTTHTTVSVSQPDPPNTPPGVCNPAGEAAIALNRAGLRVTSQNPNLLAAVTEGVTTAALSELAALYPDKGAGYVIAVARRQHAEGPKAITPGATHATPRRLSAVDRIQAHVEAARAADRDRGDVIESTAKRIPG